MIDEPEIVKQLRHEEKIRILQNQTPCSSEYLTTYEKKQEEEESKFTGGLKRIDDDIYFEELELKYQTIFENYCIAITIADEKERIISWNKYTEYLLNMDEKELYLRNVSTLYPPEEWKKIREKNIRQKGMKNKLITKINRKNKKPLDVEISLCILKSLNGKIVGSIGIIKYISELNNTTKKLLESEKKLRDIFNSTSDFLIYLEKGIILDINLAAMRLADLEKKDIIGKDFKVLKELFTNDDLKKHIDAINNTNKGKDVKEYQIKIKTKKGLFYEFLFSVDCINNDQEVKGILLRGRDITVRQKAWEELVKLEEKYRVLAETSADGVITIDPLGRITYANPSFEKMIKRRKSQILATLFRDYLSEDSVYYFQQIFIDCRKKDGKIENVELELILPYGTVIPIEVNIAPFKKDGDFAGMVCTIRDITERRKVEDELKKSERLKTEFMNIAAHELKSPVTPIKGYLELIISDKNASNQIKDWAKVSLRNSERLLRLVNDILDVSRLDTDTMMFEMEKIPIVEILDEIAEDMKASVENKGVKFITNIPRNLPSIMGDRHRLAQVLKNLFINAIKFTDCGSISINAEQKKDYIIIEVKDTGIGISNDEVKKIFNKFYQAYTGNDRKNEGTGLGLFICKEILQKHNGDIWVESQIGKGSSFFVKLPYLHKMVVNLKN